MIREKGDLSFWKNAYDIVMLTEGRRMSDMGTDKKNIRENEDPLEPLYRRMRTELPENETERRILETLAKGGTITECMEIWAGGGFPEEGFRAFLKKAEEWEVSHMCAPGKRRTE